MEIIIKIPEKSEIIKKGKRVVVSRYAKFFDESCYTWTKESARNLAHLRAVEKLFTERLQREGHVFLNDVYAMLGIPKTRDGQVVGWFYDRKNPIGDNYVDFGIYNEGNEDFVNGYTPTVLLDFNVDGVIIDRI